MTPTPGRPRLVPLMHATSFPSPLTAADLDPAAAAAFGVYLDADTITRREAMRVPAVRRGRAIIAGTIGAMSWRVMRGADPVERTLITQPNPDTTSQFIWTWVVDDLLFNGLSWLRVIDREADRFPRYVERITRDRVLVVDETDPRTGARVQRVHVDGAHVPDRDLIRIDGPDEGVLTYGATTIRTCLLLEAAVRKFARLDVPLGYLTPAEGATELSTEAGTAGDGTDRSEVDALLDEWEAARAHRTTAFLNRAVTYSTVMFDAQRVQLSEARQHQATEVARLMNLPPRYVNAPQASGMTYSSTESDRRDLLDTTLQQYITAITQRLSMGDVTPRGNRVIPDVWSWLRGDTATVIKAGADAITAGIMDAAEVRTEWLGLSPRTTNGDLTP